MLKRTITLAALLLAVGTTLGGCMVVPLAPCCGYYHHYDGWRH